MKVPDLVDIRLGQFQIWQKQRLLARDEGEWRSTEWNNTSDAVVRDKVQSRRASVYHSFEYTRCHFGPGSVVNQ